MVVESAMFVEFLIGYIGPLSCVSMLSVEWLLILEDVVQSLFEHVFVWCLLFDPH